MGKYRKRSGCFIPALIVIFCMAGLFGALYASLTWVKSAVLQRVLDIRFMARDEIMETVPVRGLLIRSEEPVKAPVPGELILKVQDGERLRVGMPLAEIRGVENSTVESPRAGVFCTHVDGLENLLVPEKIGEINFAAVENIEPTTSPAENQVQSGQFLGRVVDNLQPVYIHVHAENLANEASGAFRLGGTVQLLYKEEDLAGRIEEVRSVDGELDLVIRMRDFPDEFIHPRYVDLDLVTQQLSGWLLPSEALVFKNGVPGLFMVSRQRVQWIPVSVNDRLGDTVSVTGDALSDALRYVSNPRWVREGDRLKSGG